MRIKFRSILYCLGRSNASYFDPTIKHPAIFNDHFSGLVFLTYGLHFGLMVYYLTVDYFFRYQFKSGVKDNATDAFFLGTTPLYFVASELSPFISLYAYLRRIIYKNSNVLKGHSDGDVISGAQHYFFYRYFREIRYFFYYKIFWYDGKGLLTYIYESLQILFEEDAEFREDHQPGPHMLKAQKKMFDERAKMIKAKKLGLVYVRDTSYIKSKVLFNKEIYYPSKLPHYFNYRKKTKIEKPTHFKNSSSWV